MVSTAFAPLAQVVGEGIGHMALPIVSIAHPVAHPDANVVVQAGRTIVEDCIRALTSELGAIQREFEGKQHPLPRGVMPR